MNDELDRAFEAQLCLNGIVFARDNEVRARYWRGLEEVVRKALEELIDQS